MGLVKAAPLVPGALEHLDLVRLQGQGQAGSTIQGLRRAGGNRFGGGDNGAQLAVREGLQPARQGCPGGVVAVHAEP